jgi:hypothetical protein
LQQVRQHKLLILVLVETLSHPIDEPALEHQVDLPLGQPVPDRQLGALGPVLQPQLASALQRLRQIRLRGTSLLADAGGIFLIQILEYFLYGYYVAILGVYVVEICLVGVGVAVADSFARHDRSEAILQSVHHRCPDAARGRGTGDDERVYPSSGK